MSELQPTWHDYFLCQNCQRMTVSMLCGCERPTPLGPFQLVMAPHPEPLTNRDPGDETDAA